VTQLIDDCMDNLTRTTFFYVKECLCISRSILCVTRERLSMAKGKSQETGMTAEINSIPTCDI
jgi:hypothetical protein